MFWTGVFTLALLVFAFIATEQHIWHHPRYEFVFWLIVVTMFTCLVTLSPDSPLHYFITLNMGPISLTLFLGVCVPLVASFVLESSRVAGLSSFRPMGRRQKNSGNHAARAKKHSLDSLLDRLTYSSQTRWFAAWLRGTIEERQQRVQEILMNADTDELNHIFENINVPRLFTYANYTFKDLSTIDYIMEERVNELSVLPRAALLHSLMKMGTLMFRKQQMEWACKLFCGATGDDLTILKNFMDSGGDYNNLYKLIYVDVTEPAIRKRMLDHIKREGEAIREQNQSKGHHGLKVLSDVDDTLYSSGGRFPAGCDDRYPHHTVYPGCLILYEEMDFGQRFLSRKNERKRTSRRSTRVRQRVRVRVAMPFEMADSDIDLMANVDDTIAEVHQIVQSECNLPPWRQTLTISSLHNDMVDDENDTGMEKSRGGNLVFLSARPHAYKDVTEKNSYATFHKLHKQGRMHTTPTLLAGSLKSGLRAVLLHHYERFQLRVEGLVEFWTAVLAASYTFIVESMMDKKSAQKRMSRRKSIIKEMEDEEDGMSTVSSSSQRRSMGRSSKSQMTHVERFFSHLDTNTSSRIQREVTTKNWEAVARTKARSFRKYARLYPEYDFVFFGDNGQGDVMAAELVATYPELKNRLLACFMHEVQPHEKTLSLYADSEKEGNWKKRNIFHFKSYTGAALQAYQLGLIEDRALHRVATGAQDELMEMIVRKPMHSCWDLIVDELNSDIRKVNAVLQSRGDDSGYLVNIPLATIPYTE